MPPETGKIQLPLPARSAKPRACGLTMVLDPGLPTRQLADVLESHAGLVDLVKLGWGTALVTADLDAKLGILRDHGIDYLFGGTLFERFVLDDRLDEFVALCERSRCPVVEVSNGTIPLTQTGKASYITKLSGQFRVLSEVGFKDPARSAALGPQGWADAVEEDLGAGAWLVVTEARESGRSGLASPDGEARLDVLEAILEVADARRLLFEAPTKPLQVELVSRIGPDVNLGNIAAADVVSVETLRLGLRSDTLGRFARSA